MKTVACVVLAVLLALMQGSEGQDVCNKSCTREYHPLCVSFKQTLPNECEAENEICRMRNQGYVWSGQESKACQCQEFCTREYNPVCARDKNNATNTKTFSNLCVFENEICKKKPWQQVARSECGLQFLV